MTHNDNNEFEAITRQLIDSLTNRAARVLRRCAGVNAADLPPAVHQSLARFYDSGDVGSLLKLAQDCSKQARKIKKAESE